MILDEIVTYKRLFVAHAKELVPFAELRSRASDAALPSRFTPAIRRKSDADVNVIAEIKKASPSKGVIREDFDPVAIAAQYAEFGAAAISVLTDEEFFQGKLDYLRAVHRELPEMPLLRKDFTIDEYQIYEARAAGASAVLLIAAVLDKHQLRGFRELAQDLRLDALTEIHTEREADLAAEQGARLLGVNNRDLRDFSVDLAQTERVLQILGRERDQFTIVAESGISKPEDVDFMRKLGVDALLVGESLMREKHPGEALRALLGNPEE